MIFVSPSGPEATNEVSATYTKDWIRYDALDTTGKLNFLSDAIGSGSENDCWKAAREVRRHYYELGPGVGRRFQR
jgi:hypothetical protein